MRMNLENIGHCSYIVRVPIAVFCDVVKWFQQVKFMYICN